MSYEKSVENVLIFTFIPHFCKYSDTSSEETQKDSEENVASQTPDEPEDDENIEDVEDIEDEEEDDEPKKSHGNPFGFGGFPNISFVNLADLQEGMGGRTRVKKKKKDNKPLIELKDIPAPHKIKEQLDEYNKALQSLTGQLIEYRNDRDELANDMSLAGDSEAVPVRRPGV